MWLFQFHTSSTCLHWLNSALCSEPDAPLAFTLITDSFIGKHHWILFSDMITQTDQSICPGIMEKLSLFCLMAYATVKKCKGKLYLSSDSCWWKRLLSSSRVNLSQPPWFQLRRVTELGSHQFIWSLSASHQPTAWGGLKLNRMRPHIPSFISTTTWDCGTRIRHWIFRATGKQGKKHIWFCETVPCTQKWEIKTLVSPPPQCSRASAISRIPSFVDTEVTPNTTPGRFMLSEMTKLPPLLDYTLSSLTDS